MKTIALFAAIVMAIAPFVADAGALKSGDQVPAFTLANYDGKEYTLDNVVKGNTYTVVMFIATQCPVSNAYNERMVELNKKFSGKGIAFIGINSNKQEAVAEIAEHSKKNSFAFPVLKDNQNVIADAYAAEVTPEVFVMDKNRKLIYHGRIDDNRKADKVTVSDLSVTLETLLGGKKLEGEQYKAFGCTIKRVEKAAPPKATPES